MQHNTLSLRPFIGSKDFNISRGFYRDLGFEEAVIDTSMSLFKINDFGFYLQNAYVKDWIDNTMLFLEVDDVQRYYTDLLALGLHEKYDGARLSPIVNNSWGSECFLHDPCGILWHFGEFKK